MPNDARVLSREELIKIVYGPDGIKYAIAADSIAAHDENQRAALFTAENHRVGLMTILGVQNGTFDDALAVVEAQRERIAELEAEVARLSEVPNAAHWRALVGYLVGYASLDPDPVVLIQAITNDYLTMRASSRQAAEQLATALRERDEARKLLSAQSALTTVAIDKAESLSVTIATLRARLVAAERDTARLSWLIGKLNFQDDLNGFAENLMHEFLGESDSLALEFRKAIDAAMHKGEA